ncbi:MAG: diguanylate cyclase [Clostridiales bacterium]|nr:diguanylate cyclase [Clostridiales bacterium]
MTSQPLHPEASEPKKAKNDTTESKTHPNGEAFFRYLYKHSLHEKRYVLYALSVFNLLLLIPDLLIIESTAAKIFVALFRTLLSGGMIVFFSKLSALKNFRIYSRILSAIEIFGVFVFLFVLMSYPEPDFLIQSMGMLLIILVIFMFPNNWFYMVSITFISICAFLLIGTFLIADLSYMSFFAGFVYLVVAGVICAVSARGTERYRRRHFLSLQALRKISTTDTLTRTCNRASLEHDGEKWIELCRSLEQPLSVVFIDLDNLKIINDTHGHIVGDRILIETVSRIRDHLNARDIICRWGGDEFVLLLPGTDVIEAVRIVERIRDHVTGKPFSGGVVTSCSFGIAGMDKDSTLKSLIYNADQMMYRAKRKGKNSIEFQNQPTTGQKEATKR